MKTLLTEALAARELPEAEQAGEAERIGTALDTIINRPQHCDPYRRLVKHLANERHALLSFLADAKVDATNWRAEQAIRPAVVNRKGVRRNLDENGAATQPRMMTYFRTAVQKGVDPSPASSPSPEHPTGTPSAASASPDQLRRDLTRSRH